MKRLHIAMMLMGIVACQYVYARDAIPFMTPDQNQPQTVPQNQPPSELDLEFVVQPLDASLAFYQLEAQAYIKPSPIFMDGRAFLAYEVFVSNVGSEPFKIARVDVLNGDNLDRMIASYGSEQLIDMIKSFQLTNPDASQTLTIKPGGRAVLYFMPQMAGKRDIPSKIVHRFVLRSPDASNSDEDDSRDFLMHAAAMDVSAAPPIVVGPPLQGSHWLAANGPSNSSLHRRMHIANHGIMFYPERFAIDFMQVGTNGKLYKNDTSKNENYYGYGANVYSVANGKVVSVLDGVPNNAPGSHNYQITLDKLGGNYVLIDIGGKRYAYYAHLAPHSIKVKRGDVVQKGQLLGQLGNSGNSDAPHLHFQITDKPSSLSAQGVPYGFDQFYTESYKVPNPDADDPNLAFTTHRTQRKGEAVHENALVDFGNNIQ